MLMDLVRFLCELDEEGKCQDRRNYRDEHGNTLLHAACERNHAEREVEALILYGVDVNATNHEGKTALHYAAHRHNIMYCKLLVANGANINALDSEKKAPLHMAAMADGSEDEIFAVCTYLIEHDASVAVLDAAGHFPIYYTFMDRVAALFVEHAQFIENKQRVPTYDNIAVDLFRMARAGSVRLCKEMLARGAEIGTDEDGRTALHIIVMQDFPAARCINICEQLINASSTVLDKQDNNGCTALSLACRDSVADILIRHGADVEQMHLHDPEIVFKAAKYLSVEIVKRWIARGIDVNQQTNDGQTLLHIVLRKVGRTTIEPCRIIIQALIGAGARTDIQDGSGVTAAQLVVDPRYSRYRLPIGNRKRNDASEQRYLAAIKRLKKSNDLSRFYEKVPERLHF